MRVKSSAIRGSPKGCTPTPTVAVPAPTSRPKSSQMQISADRSGSSSYPINQSATITFGSSLALRAKLDPAVAWGVEADIRLRFAHEGARVEPVLPDRAPERPRERARLQRRDPDLAVELRAPRLLFVSDQQAEKTAAELVPRGRSLPAAPVRQVVGEPTIRGERAALECVLELELVRHGVASNSSSAGTCQASDPRHVSTGPVECHELETGSRGSGSTVRRQSASADVSAGLTPALRAADADARPGGVSVVSECTCITNGEHTRASLGAACAGVLGTALGRRRCTAGRAGLGTARPTVASTSADPGRWPQREAPPTGPAPGRPGGRRCVLAVAGRGCHSVRDAPQTLVIGNVKMMSPSDWARI